MAMVDVVHDLLEKVGQPVLQVENATEQILTKMKLIIPPKNKVLWGYIGVTVSAGRKPYFVRPISYKPLGGIQ